MSSGDSLTSVRDDNNQPPHFTSLSSAIVTTRFLTAVGDGIPGNLGGPLKAAAGIATLLLDQIEQTRQNEEDRKMIRTEILTLIDIIRSELSKGNDIEEVDSSHTGYTLCEEFTSALRDMMGNLGRVNVCPSKNGLLRRLGLRRLQHILAAKKVHDEIMAIRQKLGDMKMNFLIATTIGTRCQIDQAHANAMLLHQNAQELSLHSRQDSISDYKSFSRCELYFRSSPVKVRDLLLLQQGQSSRYYHGTVGGCGSVKTICVYKGAGASNTLKENLRNFSSVSYIDKPYVAQMYGVCLSEHLPAMIFHGVLWPYDSALDQLSNSSSLTPMECISFTVVYMKDIWTILNLNARYTEKHSLDDIVSVLSECTMYDANNQRVVVVDPSCLGDGSFLHDFNHGVITAPPDAEEHSTAYWLHGSRKDLQPIVSAEYTLTASKPRTSLRAETVNFYRTLQVCSYEIPTYLQTSEFENVHYGDVLILDEMSTVIAGNAVIDLWQCDAGLCDPRSIVWVSELSYSRTQTDTWTVFRIPNSYQGLKPGKGVYRVNIYGSLAGSCEDADLACECWFSQVEGVLARADGTVTKNDWELDRLALLGRRSTVTCRLVVHAGDMVQCPSIPDYAYLFVENLEGTILDIQIQRPRVVWSRDPESPMEDNCWLENVVEEKVKFRDDPLVHYWDDRQYMALQDFHRGSA